ncbi:spindle pole body formation-associated protein-domain-containing protein [Hypoxylon rubiginosum]|uniref:Spindle pole body formation-associated protein-domain-containing protein n=1 Tax=Hypoxylon rubiginosum TaxID=110542 RepID=A0ACB9Z0W6_9PEZI|nr:spindle pole body formation-associated protein-domain-containing protein [Hypoxylon rubiginosum]
MLGWALKKGFPGATAKIDAPNSSEDTTQLDAPDTPAPVFAARAFKNALFGAPNASEAPKVTVTTDQKHTEHSKSTSNDTQSNNMLSPSKQSPMKQPASILLTPGTGTARRKRVSFNHDVKAGSGPDSSPLASARTRKRTTLQKALDKTRRITKSENSPEKAREHIPPKSADGESEGEWEDDLCNHDMTVDLNEPHSESGKYWKSEFIRYREEAMSDIERMVRFKALAKSYAKKKDSEAIELAQALKDEKEKVTKMEQEVGLMAAKIAHKKRHGGDKEDGPLMENLAKQTNLAVQYREQVKELETILKDYKDKSATNRSDRYRINTSPRTEQTIYEVNRELRRARSELKQMDKLREENKKLKSALKEAEERTTGTREDLGKVATYQTQIQKLETQLRESKDLSRQKDHDIRKLKRDYEALKRDAKSRTAEAMQVLQIKNDKIAELEKTIKDLEIVSPSAKATQDLKASIESLGKPSKYEAVKPAGQLSRITPAEEITLDKFQRSLFADTDSTGSKLDMTTSLLPPHWSSSFKDIRSQLEKEKNELMQANKRERDSIMQDSEVGMPRSPAKNRASLQTFDSGRAMSQVLTNKLNKLSQNDHVPPTPRSGKEILEEKLTEERAHVAAPRASEDAVMHGALKPVSNATRARSHSSRPLADSKAPSLDLARNRSTRFHGRELEGSPSMNASRCTLPTDRQAAARARLEQKKLERQNGSRRLRDKENVRP